MATATDSPEMLLAPADPMARAAQTFPRLPEEMIRRVTEYGTVEQIPAHVLLFQRGQMALAGQGRLEHVSWFDRVRELRERHPISHVFVMSAAEPNTDWVRGGLSLDATGFVITGVTAEGNPASSPCATTRSGIVEVGEVRADSVKRVASSVGEGSMVVQAVHQFLSSVS